LQKGRINRQNAGNGIQTKTGIPEAETRSGNAEEEDETGKQGEERT
jgi:hypothetical protein